MASRWIDKYIEEFARPYLGPEIPNPDPNDINVQSFHRGLLIMRLINLWDKAKEWAGDRTILLPGRDTYAFFVLASIEGFDRFIFRPDISSCMARNNLIKDDYSHTFCVDTGYSGTVPMALRIPDYRLVLCTDPKRKQRHQIFPNDDRDAITAGIMECMPKPWVRMEICPSLKAPATPTQELSNKQIFANAIGCAKLIADFVEGVKPKVMSIGRHW